MTPIQIIFLVVIAAIVIKTAQKYRSSAISIREMFLWIFFWLLVGVLILFPDATQAVANLVGIGRGVCLIVYLALIALFLGMFYIVLRLEQLERDITKIVRRLALKE